MADIQTITTEDLKHRLDQGADFHFWNVLTDEYFHGELLRGSHRMPLEQPASGSNLNSTGAQTKTRAATQA